VAHEVTNVGNDTAHLSIIACQAKAALGVEKLEAVADRGYFTGEEILACDQAEITVTLPKPQRSGAKSEGRFGKQDFVYLADENVYRCPAGEKLKYRFTAEEHGQKLHRYWTDACHTCPIKAQCTTGRERRITRWEHEEVVEAVQERLDKNPNAMRMRRETEMADLSALPEIKSCPSGEKASPLMMLVWPSSSATSWPDAKSWRRMTWPDSPGTRIHALTASQRPSGDSAMAWILPSLPGAA
jgi:hypothetical protein